jgi:two-component system, sensor histidine kinase LadS
MNTPNTMAFRSRFALLLQALLLTSFAALWVPGQAWASGSEPRNIATQSPYWLDASGEATIEQVSQLALTSMQTLQPQQAFTLGDAALWVRIELPPLQAKERWHLLFGSSSFIDSVTLYQPDAASGWTVQQAGDSLPVAQWAIPDRTPVFDVGTGGHTAWLRMASKPSPLSPSYQLITQADLQQQRHWTYLMLGGYLGFGLLVIFLGWVHARLYRDRAFVIYMVYVGCMLGFQVAFTGLGGLFFWPNLAWWNNAAPAVFMLWLAATGNWFVVEVCAIERYSKKAAMGLLAFTIAGLLYPAVYLSLNNASALLVLNLYGLMTVIVGVAMMVWAWRQGERYAGWLALGFLPVQLGYFFPALRVAGVISDSWGTQYSVLIGSAIEIPVLLYILHHRAKHYNENRARLRSLDSTDPLTGLTAMPVLRLRMRDAMRRAERYGHQCAVLMVELSNHAEMVAMEGREVGDRALVVAASKLSRVVRDVDTVCRVADTRFTILIEGPVSLPLVKLMAQHFVAKGLERTSILPGELDLRFRMVSIMLPSGSAVLEHSEAPDERGVLSHLEKALDQLGADSRRMVLHLTEGVAAPAKPGSSRQKPRKPLAGQ